MWQYIKFKSIKKPEFFGLLISVIFFTVVIIFLLTGSKPNDLVETVTTSTQSPENLFYSAHSDFSEDAKALAAMMIVMPEAYNYENRTYSFRIRYDARLFRDAPASFQDSWEATIHSMPLSEAPIPDRKEYPVSVDIDSLTLYYNAENNCFTANLQIYADANHTYPIDPVYVTYIWDEATNRFIMDLNSARLQLAG